MQFTNRDLTHTDDLDFSVDFRHEPAENGTLQLPQYVITLCDRRNDSRKATIVMTPEEYDALGDLFATAHIKHSQLADQAMADHLALNPSESASSSGTSQPAGEPFPESNDSQFLAELNEAKTKVN